MPVIISNPFISPPAGPAAYTGNLTVGDDLVVRGYTLAGLGSLDNTSVFGATVDEISEVYGGPPFVAKEFRVFLNANVLESHFSSINVNSQTYITGGTGGGLGYQFDAWNGSYTAWHWWTPPNGSNPLPGWSAPNVYLVTINP